MRKEIPQLSSFEASMSVNEIIDLVLFYIRKIISHTSSFKEITPSIFDSQRKNNSDSISTSSSSDSIEKDEIIQENDLVEKIDNYEFDDYFEMCVKALKLEENLVILVLMNLDKLLVKNFILTQQNVKRVLFTCIVITHKFYEDDVYTNKDLSEIGGISEKELLLLENEFLEIIEYKLFISDESFIKYKREMEKKIKKYLWYLSFVKN